MLCLNCGDSDAIAFEPLTQNLNCNDTDAGSESDVMTCCFSDCDWIAATTGGWKGCYGWPWLERCDQPCLGQWILLTSCDNCELDVAADSGLDAAAGSG